MNAGAQGQSKTTATTAIQQRKEFSNELKR
jgi:hypothetical protein